ncbi:uncharacterized protein LOC110642387 [Hevea brasiliensis]|uniref:uncharacterized protein LOC110642387 n=1 Tax=Hevea brasiliensis TaxID=3981 RepID=UPI0025EB22E3|nr:uncharacterized protein LOC110642387 [Hevea brasiliensis]
MSVDKAGLVANSSREQSHGSSDKDQLHHTTTTGMFSNEEIQTLRRLLSQLESQSTTVASSNFINSGNAFLANLNNSFWEKKKFALRRDPYPKFLEQGEHRKEEVYFPSSSSSHNLQFQGENLDLEPISNNDTQGESPKSRERLKRPDLRIYTRRNKTDIAIEQKTADQLESLDSIPGYLEDHEWRQAITATGSACIAALSVERYLVSNDLHVEFRQLTSLVFHDSVLRPPTQEVKKEPTDRDVQEGFDITLTKHKGQYALRKLYHESPRLICVLYTAPTCGPCRTLKPILSKVIDEFDQNVHFVEIVMEEDPEIAEAAGIMDKDLLRTVSGVKMKKVQRIH